MLINISMKIRLFYIVPIVISICCFLVYSLVGSSITEDGALVEPFGLIPIGYLFLVIGIILKYWYNISNYYRIQNVLQKERVDILVLESIQ